MAQRSSAPILPYAIVSSPRHRLNTWDGFRIPYPFSRGALVFGEAVIPNPEHDRETLRQKLEDNLNAAMRRAEDMAQKKGRS